MKTKQSRSFYTAGKIALGNKLNINILIIYELEYINP